MGMPGCVSRQSSNFQTWSCSIYACLSDGYMDGDKIECPLHQGLFDIRTGKAEEGPVDEDLKVYQVKREGGRVLVDIP